MTLSARERLILALDVPGIDEALGWVDRFGDRVGLYKVGLELYTREGPAGVRALVERGAELFLDLKLHDIPRTVERSVEAVAIHVTERLASSWGRA